jgi:two-component system OmpR family response regulator
VDDTSENGTEPMNCRILVVDDDKTIRGAIAEYLNDHGFLADTAEDAKTAVGRIKAARYDIVVMEVTLPRYPGGYTGRYLLNYIHNRHPTTKTIVVTGDATVETSLESILLGASGWMTKPFSLAALQDRISAILKSKNVLALPNGQSRNHLNC